MKKLTPPQESGTSKPQAMFILKLSKSHHEILLSLILEKETCHRHCALDLNLDKHYSTKQFYISCKPCHHN